MSGDPDGTDESGASAAIRLAEEIRRRRHEAGLSNSALAAAVGYSRQYIGYAERPSRGLPSGQLVTALDTALAAGGALIALHTQALANRQERRLAATRRPTEEVPGRGKVSTSGVQRREFLAGVAAAAVGAAAPAPLARLLDGLTTGLPRRVGLSEIEAVESAAEVYMGLDLARNGDMAATFARTALSWSAELLGAEMRDQDRERLCSAVGLLADRLGWSMYDSEAGTNAGKLLTFALDHAARGADRDLRAHVMLDLSTVMTDAGHPGDGVEVLAAALGDERVSVAERANLHAVCARHCAAAGRRRLGLRHAALAEETLGRIDDVRGPDWARHITYSSGHHASALGLAYFALDDDSRARQHLTSALATLNRGRTRTGLRCRVRLAILNFRDGAREDGETEGRQVIVDAAGVKSTRVRADLRMLRSEAAHRGSELASELSRIL